MSILRWSVLYERSTKVPRTGGGVEDLTLNGKSQKPNPKRKWEEGNEREKERRRERGVAKKAIKPPSSSNGHWLTLLSTGHGIFLIRNPLELELKLCSFLF